MGEGRAERVAKSLPPLGTHVFEASSVAAWILPGDYVTTFLCSARTSCGRYTVQNGNTCLSIVHSVFNPLPHPWLDYMCELIVLNLPDKCLRSFGLRST